MSDTPRTDAAESKRDLEGYPWVKSDFARELERDLAQRTAEVVSSTRSLNRLEAVLYDRPAGRNIVEHAVETIERLRAELHALKAEHDTSAAENAALKAQPASNADEFASIPLRAWVIEVFQHLCHSPHTPDSWKRDLDEKTQVLLDAIEQGKEAKP
jgi:hypothetical protein